MYIYIYIMCIYVCVYIYIYMYIHINIYMSYYIDYVMLCCIALYLLYDTIVYCMSAGRPLRVGCPPGLANWPTDVEVESTDLIEL